MEIIYVLKSKFVFYAVLILTFIFSYVCKKMATEVKFYLNVEHRMTNSETWEMIKDESNKGNKKAKIAVWAYYLSTLFLILMGLLICLFNV